MNSTSELATQDANIVDKVILMMPDHFQPEREEDRLDHNAIYLFYIIIENQKLNIDQLRELVKKEIKWSDPTMFDQKYSELVKKGIVKDIRTTSV
ncbi:MAG: hypothetical protein ABIM99_02460 [Candidatus Dojkabacteria bacterium]